MTAFFAVVDDGQQREWRPIDGSQPTMIGRRDWRSKPAVVSREHLELHFSGGEVRARPVGKNMAFVLPAGGGAEADACGLSHGISVALPANATVAMEKSHNHLIKIKVEDKADCQDEPAAEVEDALPEKVDEATAECVDKPEEEADEPPPPPAAVAAAARPRPSEAVDLTKDNEADEGPKVVELDAEEVEKEEVDVEEVLVVDDKRQKRQRREQRRQASQAQAASSASAPAVVVDLEAENGVGLGVTGRPLLPGEREARQQRVRRMWTLRASRSTDDTPEEQHYRFAESAWCRGGGLAAQIAAVEYHFHPELEERWHAKKAEYDARFGVGGHTILFAFHGTGKHNVQPILADGFKISKVGSTTDPGYYGAGIYFSEQMAHSSSYNSSNDGMFLCKLLVGKPYHSPLQQGRGLQPGYTSHVSDPSGAEVIIFDEAAMLPCYVVKTAPAAHAAAYGVPGMLAGGAAFGMPGAGGAASEPLKGLGGSGAMYGAAGAAAPWAGHSVPHLPWTSPAAPGAAALPSFAARAHWMRGGGGRGRGMGRGRARGSGCGGGRGTGSSWLEDDEEDAELQEALKRSMSEQ